MKKSHLWILGLGGIILCILVVFDSKAKKIAKSDSRFSVLKFCLSEEDLPVFRPLFQAYQGDSRVSVQAIPIRDSSDWIESIQSGNGDLFLIRDPMLLDSMKREGKFKEVFQLRDSKESDAHGSLFLAVHVSADPPSMALRFARYMVAPNKGVALLNQAGLEIIRGDEWDENPELLLFSGGVNRPAIEMLLKQFSEREGVRVTTVFNGCGILCASMKTMLNSEYARFPDAYYACDLCFVPPVADHFPESVLLTETVIGMCVLKGNPRMIFSIADLAKPGLKVGLCNAEQSTLGYMTRGILKSSSLLDSIMKNLAVEVPTADFLINQLRAGGLDAAIVYEVNAIPVAEHLDFIPIQHEGARAIQPFAVRHDSKNRRLATRLLDYLVENRRAFEEAGFTWRDPSQIIQSKHIEIPDWLKQDR